MKIKNLIIKPTISIVERISMTDSIVDSYFIENDVTGEIEYVPYYKLMSELLSFIDYYTEGITFDEEESRYDSSSFSEQLMRQFNEFKSGNQEFIDILLDVKDIVEFKKQQLIHNKKTSLDSLLNELKDILSKFNGTFDMEMLTSLLPELAKLGKTGLDQDKLVDLILKNQPQGHKKPTKSTKTKTKKAKLEVIKDVADDTIVDIAEDFKEV